MFSPTRKFGFHKLRTQSCEGETSRRGRSDRKKLQPLDLDTRSDCSVGTDCRCHWAGSPTTLRHDACRSGNAHRSRPTSPEIPRGNSSPCGVVRVGRVGTWTAHRAHYPSLLATTMWPSQTMSCIRTPLGPVQQCKTVQTRCGRIRRRQGAQG